MNTGFSGSLRGLRAVPVCKLCSQPVFPGQKSARVPNEQHPEYTRVAHERCVRPGHPVPRLIKSMMYVACLSEGEAQHTVQMYRQGLSGPGFGTEAVVHFGGPLVVIQAALNLRLLKHKLPPATLSYFGLGRLD